MAIRPPARFEHVAPYEATHLPPCRAEAQEAGVAEHAGDRL